MPYTKPGEVISPKAHWRLFSPILDRGEGDCAYALGMWDGEARIGFRWNGDDASPLGNPQSRGLPTWTMLDPALYEAVLTLLPSGKRALARNFLGLQSVQQLQEISAAAVKLHDERVNKITNGETPCALADGARLIFHVIPFSAVSDASHRPLPNLFKSPERFPAVSIGGPPSVGMGSVRLDFDGFLIGSNDSGLGEPQKAYVSVSQWGVLESVTKISVGQGNRFIELPKVLQTLVRYARLYAGSLSACGVEPPCIIRVSLQNVEGVRLLRDLIEQGTFPEDMPDALLAAPRFAFREGILETVPGTESECATALAPVLNHISYGAGLPIAPCFGPDGEYLWRDAASGR